MESREKVLCGTCGSKGTWFWKSPRETKSRFSLEVKGVLDRGGIGGSE